MRNILRKIRARLVDDARYAWRWLSMQFLAAAAILEAFAQALKKGWVELPEDLKAMVPGLIGQAIGALIFLAIIGRLVKQKK